MANANEVTFNVTKSIWRLNAATNGWQKEVNLVSWNGGKPKLDIRDWNHDKTKLKKGIILSSEEAIELRKCLNEIGLETLFNESNENGEIQSGPGPANSGIAYISSNKSSID